MSRKNWEKWEPLRKPRIWKCGSKGIKNDYEGFGGRGRGKINKKQREKRKIKKTKVKRGIVENKDVNHSKTIEIKDNQNS